MKRANLLLIFAVFLSGITFGQLGTATATYNLGDIETDKNFSYYSGTQSSDCPGQMSVNIPEGSTILSVDVAYDMTSDENSAVNKQRSHFRCVSPGGTAEASMTNGPSIYVPGTASYERLGLDIANGVVGGGDIQFELHAGATYYKDYCSTDSVKADNNTWTISITYIPPGYPSKAFNPVPENGAGYIATDVDLTWEFGTDTETYDLYFGTDNPPMTKVVENATAGDFGSYDPGMLDLTTTYYWQIVSKNSNGYTEGDVWEFTTVCGTFDTPFSEDFEGITTPELPYCWQGIVNSTSGSAAVQTTSYYGVGGSQCLKLYNADDISATVIFVSPEIELDGGSLADKMVSFSMMGFSYPYLSVGTMSDPADESTYTEYQSFIVYDYITEHDVYFNDYTGTDTYIAFKLEAYNVYQDTYLDEITIDDLPTCIKPTGIYADNLTINSAEIFWTDLNGATAWNIEYGPKGFTPTGTPTVSGVTNPYEITGINASTEYDVYVQTDCGGGDVSAWAGPETFMTPCDYFEAPFSQNFDAGLEMPACWTSIIQTADSWTINGIQNIGAYSAPYSYHMENGWDMNSTLILATPPVSDLAGKKVTFWAKNSMGDFDLEVGTMSDPGDPNTYTMLTSVTTSISYQEFEVWLNEYNGTDEYIALKHGNGASYVAMDIDDVSVDLLPSCLPPAGLMVDNITTTDANFHFTETGNSSDWIVEIGAMGFTPGTETYLNQYLVNNPNGGEQVVALEGLTAATSYDVYVMSDCGGGDMSGWAGPATFLTGFEVLDLPVSEDFENGMGVTGNAPNNDQNWDISADYSVSGAQSVHNAFDVNADNVLFVLGNFDFTGKTDVMLSFWHIAKTDGNYDHCYVEISTDGGATFDQLPESTYAGAGFYREEGVYNNPEGPSFDGNSYEIWKSGPTPDNTWWRQEYFDLTDYNSSNQVQIRFRVVSDGYGISAGWFIDDLAIESIGTPEFSVDPVEIETTVNLADPMVSSGMTMENNGTFPVSYTAQVVYDEVALIDENFDAGIPETWTIVKNGTSEFTWSDTASLYGRSLDGTRFAWCDGLQGYAPVTNTINDDLISPEADASAYANGILLLEFDQVFDADYNSGDTARVYVFNGMDWVMIYESWTDDGSIYGPVIHKSYDVTEYANANFKVRFNYIDGPEHRGRFFAIDNVKLRASMSALDWLTLGGETMVEGVIIPSEMMTITADMDATGLALGTYLADIEITSNDPENASLTVPVTMLVAPIAPPTALTAVADLEVINLTYNLNEAGYDVMIVSNTVDLFDQPENGTEYPVGSVIGNNGTVIYQGSMTEFAHTDLAPNTTFYYQAWSVKNMMYSPEAASANATTGDYQLICLPAGWSGVSSYKVPENPALEDVLSEINNELVMMISNAGIYWAPYNINTIGDWDTQKGYKIKVNEDACFAMVGDMAGNKTITLNTGANYIPVLCDQPVSANDIFSQFGNSMVYAYDLNTEKVYWDEGGIYTLDWLEPGVGYIVSMSQPGEATFDCEGPTKSGVVNVQKQQIENAPWIYTQTGNQHLISINQSAFVDLEKGDFVGVFNSYGTCAGYTQYNGENSNLLLVAYSDDMTTDEIDGLQEGENMTFRVFRQSQQFETEVAVSFDASMPNTGAFSELGLSMILKIGTGATGIQESNTANINVYPNPATTYLTIDIGQIENDISVLLMDLGGRVLINTTVVGKTDLDVSTFQPGVYFLEISTGNSIETHKVIIK